MSGPPRPSPSDFPPRPPEFGNHFAGIRGNGPAASTTAGAAGGVGGSGFSGFGGGGNIGGGSFAGFQGGGGGFFGNFFGGSGVGGTNIGGFKGFGFGGAFTDPSRQSRPWNQPAMDGGPSQSK